MITFARRMSYIGISFIAIALAFGAVESVNLIRHSTSMKERENRVVLVRNLLEAYRERFGAYPDSHENVDNRSLSWRINILNRLHSKFPSEITETPGLDSLQYPLNASSPRPHCYGASKLSVYCVLSANGTPAWNTLQGSEGESADFSPGIVVEGEFGGADGIGWALPADARFNGDSVSLETETTSHRIELVRNVYVLRKNGEVEWIKGPMASREFAAVVRGNVVTRVQVK